MRKPTLLLAEAALSEIMLHDNVEVLLGTSLGRKAVFSLCVRLNQLDGFPTNHERYCLPENAVSFRYKDNTVHDLQGNRRCSQ